MRHGLSQTSEYFIWGNIIQRCCNPDNDSYARYGGKGITICAEWRDFAKFIADVGRRPSMDHSIDRIDGSRGYEPGNVRWATLLEQANNKTTNRLVDYRGQRLTIAQAARAGNAGVTRETARCRIHNGWDVADAVETPPLFRRDAQRRRIRT